MEYKYRGGADMSEADKIAMQVAERNLADINRLKAHPSYKYDKTNYCVDYGKDSK